MVAAIIVAGGSGSRMGSRTAKQYLPLGGVPVLQRTLLPFDRCAVIEIICLVAPEADMAMCRRRIVETAGMETPVLIVAGGDRRQDSVRKGLEALAGKVGTVAIHDGVRPFVTPKQIEACVSEAERSGACMLGIPAFETLKRTADDGRIETIDRGRVWLAQTPQTFSFELIEIAHRKALTDSFDGTDDAMLVERLGRTVKIIEGSRFNIKITTPEDLLLAEAILKTGDWG